MSTVRLCIMMSVPVVYFVQYSLRPGSVFKTTVMAEDASDYLNELSVEDEAVFLAAESCAMAERHPNIEPTQLDPAVSVAQQVCAGGCA